MTPLVMVARATLSNSFIIRRVFRVFPVPTLVFSCRSYHIGTRVVPQNFLPSASPLFFVTSPTKPRARHRPSSPSTPPSTRQRGHR
jgi:hypothetical protein